MHFGYVEFDLCPVEAETNNCFQSLILTGGSHRLRNNRQMCVPLDGSSTRREFVNVQLPAGVRCNRCTLRWTYRTSYPGPANWDPCFDHRQLAQTFRGNFADLLRGKLILFSVKNYFRMLEHPNPVDCLSLYGQTELLVFKIRKLNSSLLQKVYFLVDLVHTSRCP